MARVKEGGTPSYAQDPLSLTPYLIAVQLPPTHAQPSWPSGTVLELPQIEGSVEEISLHHAAIWAELDGLGYGGRDTFECPSPSLRNPTFDRSSTAHDARTTELALWNCP